MFYDSADDIYGSKLIFILLVFYILLTGSVYSQIVFLSLIGRLIYTVTDDLSINSCVNTSHDAG